MPVEVVRRFGAVQAQDYLGSPWAIVRTWPMRGTLHFAPAAGVGLPVSLGRR